MRQYRPIVSLPRIIQNVAEYGNKNSITSKDVDGTEFLHYPLLQYSWAVKGKTTNEVLGVKHKPIKICFLH